MHIEPLSNVRRRTAERRKTVWSREDVQKFLDAAYSDFSTRNIGLIAHMAYEWCQRLGDMRLLTWDAIDFDARTLTLSNPSVKLTCICPFQMIYVTCCRNNTTILAFKSTWHPVRTP